MEEVKAKTKQKRHCDRVALEKDCLKKIDGWIDQVTHSNKGVVLTRKDLANWIIATQDVVLPSNSVSELTTKFFNEVRFLQQAIKEVKAAKNRGEEVNLTNVLVHRTACFPRSGRPGKKVRSDSSAAPQTKLNPTQNTDSNDTKKSVLDA